MSNPAVSVLMSAYNRQAYLDDAIRSVVSQTFEDWELVLIDNGSTDSTPVILRDWAHKDSRIRVVVNPKNVGVPKVRNQGARIASGRYVSFIDSDDLYRKDALQRMVGELEQNLDYDVLIAEAALIDENGQITGETNSQRMRWKPKCPARVLFDDLIANSFVVCNLVRNEVLRKNGICHDEELGFADDWMFWLDLSAVCNIRYLPESLYYYRIHRSNTSMSELAKEIYAKDFTVIPEKVFWKHASILGSRQKSEHLAWAAGFLDHSSLESAKMRAAFYRSIIADVRKPQRERFSEWIRAHLY